MIVSESKGFVFVHNPRTGGSALRRVLSEYAADDGVFWDHGWSQRFQHIVDRAHIPLCEINEFCDPGVFRRHLVFGFVRDPYSRMYSAFQQHRKMNFPDRELDFNEFANTHLNEHSVFRDANLCHFMPQHFFFYLGRKCMVDYIGRHERAVVDRAVLSELLDIDLSSANGAENVSALRLEAGEKSLGEIFEPRTLSLCNRLYARDFLLFGYPRIESQSDNIAYSEYWKRIERETAARNHELKALQQQCVDYRRQLENADRNIDALRSELDRLRSSTTWRIARMIARASRPLRRLFD